MESESVREFCKRPLQISSWITHKISSDLATSSPPDSNATLRSERPKQFVSTRSSSLPTTAAAASERPRSGDILSSLPCTGEFSREFPAPWRGELTSPPLGDLERERAFRTLCRGFAALPSRSVPPVGLRAMDCKNARNLRTCNMARKPYGLSTCGAEPGAAPGSPSRRCTRTLRNRSFCVPKIVSTICCNVPSAEDRSRWDALGCLEIWKHLRTMCQTHVSLR
mmetsp:Transcript_86102/g.240768  ORF Transcript_86102/g.240768 Transcript_86102/m.240768 type:complete len:224 (-) Transcript_86102:527-1198(-)